MKKKRMKGRCIALMSAITVFLSVILSCGNTIPAMAAYINQGANIPYGNYLPGASYSTHYYTVDGRTAYCIEAEKSAVPSGEYGSSTIDYSVAPMLVLALHYGPGGDGAWQMKKYFLEEKGIDLSDEQQYLYTHIIANYAYVGANLSATPGQYYKGLNDEIAEASGINDWIRFIARVLAGSPDYTGGQVVGGYASVYGTSSQNIALIGNVDYAFPQPPVDTPKRGKIAVSKTGPTLAGYENGFFVFEEKGLSGAEFSLFAADEIKEKEEVLYEKDALVGTMVTTEDGSAAIENLPMGNYSLLETKAPEGYQISEEPILIMLSEDNAVNNVIVQNVSLHDDKKNLVIELHKSDNATSAPLKGAKFGLYAAEDITVLSGEVLVTKDTLLKEAESDENGVIDFSVDLPLFSYYVKEISAPYGYVPGTEVFSVNPANAAESGAEIKVSHTFTNAAVKGEAIFTKKGESPVAFEDGNFVYEERALSGAEFDLFRENGELVAHLTGDENGIVKAEDLALGKYYLKETKAPYGMVSDDSEISFEIAYAGQNTPKVLYTDSIVNRRKKVSLKVSKIDGSTKTPLSGGSFDLYSAEDIKNCDGDVIVQKDMLLKSAAAKEGVVDFQMDLPVGSYYVKESVAPNGYNKTNETFYANFDGDSDEEIPEVEISISNIQTPPPVMPPERPKKVSPQNYVTEDAVSGEYAPLISENLSLSGFAQSGMEAKYPPYLIASVKAGIVGITALFFALLSVLIKIVRRKG